MNNTTTFGLARIEKKVKDIHIKWDEIAEKYRLDSTTLTKIKNAWQNHAVVDNLGYVWLEFSGVGSVLRIVKRKKAKYFVDNFISEYDKRTINGKTYIRGTVLGKMIDENIQGARTSKKRRYSKFSRDLYQIIVDHDVCENIRAISSEELVFALRKMKTERLKFLKGTKYEDIDELTLDDLEKNAHFSHVRSVSLFPELALAVWNGLLVNSETHKLITKQNIQDEKQLVKLCKEKGWSTKWTKPFKAALENRGFKAFIN